MTRFFSAVPVRQLLLGGAAAFALIAGSSSIASADSPPQIDHNYPTPQPDYPDTAQVGGEHGDVLVDVYVTSSGKVRKYRINQSSGFDDLDNAAVGAVSSWHYLPAIKNGEAVSDWKTLKIHFSIPAAEQAAAAAASSSTAPVKH